MSIKIPGLPHTRGQNAYRLTLSANAATQPTAGSALTNAPLVSNPDAYVLLEQLSQVRRLINDSLDVVDVSTWAGDMTDAGFISGQLRLLREHLSDAKGVMTGEGKGKWMEDVLDANVSLYSYDVCEQRHFSLKRSISCFKWHFFSQERNANPRISPRSSHHLFRKTYPFIFQ
jgi:Rogdi leucine zipper containing protein